ncbi:hypothetical protein BACCIP111883_00758 [Sutcliffiella rhizosphaerae]|uniref:Uncharacterized protein n=1 Tax=Sutcliffiella rhizosphaerae TaxID=2880967 RepID=A0ABN8ABD3_9BACI|nr:hypothetical protein BACCIP111883_00758 [Sutcliffiella rhizosphaerae]
MELTNVQGEYCKSLIKALSEIYFQKPQQESSVFLAI